MMWDCVDRECSIYIVAVCLDLELMTLLHACWLSRLIEFYAVGSSLDRYKITRGKQN
jgi:hypothetical protein